MGCEWAWLIRDEPPLHRASLLHLGQQPDGPGELGYSPALGLCISIRQEAGEGGHSPAAKEPDPEPGPEDRHGQQDEEDG